MFEMGLKKLLIAIGYSAEEVEQGLQGPDAQAVFAPVKKSVWGWALVVVGGPVLAPFVVRGVEWLNGLFGKREVK